MRHSVLAFLFIATTGATPGPAQQFETRTPRQVLGQYEQYLAPADFDGDGDADLLGATASGMGIARNDGQNRFPVVLPISDRTGVDVVFAIDLDNDGDQDIVGIQTNWATGQYSPVLLRNDGAVFTDVTATNLPAGFSHHQATCTFLDLDGDRDVDILFAGRSPAVLLNDGSGVLSDGRSTWIPPGVAGVPVDVDGDGRDDLVSSNALLRNTGSGFVDETALRLPAGLVWTGYPSAADIDGDGDPDLLFYSVLAAKLLRNDNGIFSEVTGAPLPQLQTTMSDKTFLDADGDGDQDIYLSPGHLLRNDGVGTFTLESAPPSWLPLLAIDAEGDGDEDITYILPRYLDILRNDGVGNFVRSNAADVLVPDPAQWFDVDGDGDLDVMSGRRLFRNDGAGRFAVSTLPIGPSENSPTLIGDFDGDGDLDVIADGIYHNDGTGMFTVGASLPLSPVFWYPIAHPTDSHSVVGDFDGDGDLDLVGLHGPFANTAVCLHRNDGTGTFTADTTVFPALSLTWSLQAGDFDGDGDLDVLASGFSPAGAPTMLVNQNGRFTVGPSLPLTGGRARFVQLHSTGPPEILCGGALFRLQNGAFVDVTAATFPRGAPTVSSEGDVDLDGDPDVLTFDSRTRLGWLARNDGRGRFPVWEPTNLQDTAQLLDVDGDGDLDAVTPTGVWWNRERQVSLPLPPHTGRTLRVEVWSRPGRATAQDAALLGIGAARRAAPLLGPFGALHVDALGAVVPVAIAPGRGVAELDLPVPNVPALRGADLFFQALHSTPLGLHFSNLAIGRIE